MRTTNKAVFFDRDGVINYDSGYTYRKEEFEWNDGSIEAIKWLNDNNWLVIVVTNQSGIARGYYSENDVIALHEWMNERLKEYSAKIDDFYFCPHLINGSIQEYMIECDCRKPKPGMIKSAIKKWKIDKDSAILFGDKDSDMVAASSAGIKGVKYSTGNLASFVRGHMSNGD